MPHRRETLQLFLAFEDRMRFEQRAASNSTPSIMSDGVEFGVAAVDRGVHSEHMDEPYETIFATQEGNDGGRPSLAGAQVTAAPERSFVSP